MRWTMLLPVLVCLSGLQAQLPVKTVNELKAFYVVHCVRCHGYDGSSHNALGKKLNAANFTDQAKMAREVDAKLAKTIRKGIFFGMIMPPFKKRLSEADSLLMVSEVLRKAEPGKAIAPAR